MICLFRIVMNVCVHAIAFEPRPNFDKRSHLEMFTNILSFQSHGSNSLKHLLWFWIWEQKWLAWERWSWALSHNVESFGLAADRFACHARNGSGSATFCAKCNDNMVWPTAQHNPMHCSCDVLQTDTGRESHPTMKQCVSQDNFHTIRMKEAHTNAAQPAPPTDPWPSIVTFHSVSTAACAIDTHMNRGGERAEKSTPAACKQCSFHCNMDVGSPTVQLEPCGSMLFKARTHSTPGHAFDLVILKHDHVHTDQSISSSITMHGENAVHRFTCRDLARFNDLLCKADALAQCSLMLLCKLQITRLLLSWSGSGTDNIANWIESFGQHDDASLNLKLLLQSMHDETICQTKGEQDVQQMFCLSSPDLHMLVGNPFH